MKGSVKMGFKCEVCGNKYCVTIGTSESKCRCGGNLIPDPNAKDVTANFTCPDCEYSSLMIIGAEHCPECGRKIE